MKKICSHCKDEKEVQFFGQNRLKTDGINTICKKCITEAWHKKKSTKYTSIIQTEKEIWIPVKYYENLYHISNKGRIKSCLKTHYSSYLKTNIVLNERLLNKIKTSDGYEAVSLYKDGNSKQYRFHRLLADAFIPNPDKKPFINHINGVKNDNNIDNLEWVTARENTSHAHLFGLASPKMSKYIGVHWVKRDKIWIATITIEKSKTKYLGSFKTEEEAYEAYKKAINEYGIINKYIQV